MYIRINKRNGEIESFKTSQPVNTSQSSHTSNLNSSVIERSVLSWLCDYLIIYGSIESCQKLETRTAEPNIGKQDEGT